MKGGDRLATITESIQFHDAVTFGNIERQIIRVNAEQINLNATIQSGEEAANGLLDQFKSLAEAMNIKVNVGKIVELSDQMATTKAHLDSMVDEHNTVEGLQQKIFQAAEKSRGSYLATADAVAKIGNLAQNAFGSNDEIIAFTEQINKHFIISGTSAQGINDVMGQLTESIARGALNGDVLNSVFSETPTIVQAIADYMGIGIEEVSRLAEEGQITANVLRNAMFSAVNETNAALENIPMTWAQVWTSVVNKAIMVSQPLLEFINLLAKNWNTLEPIVLAVAIAVGIYTAALKLQTIILGLKSAAISLAIAAHTGLIGVMMMNPLATFAIMIGIVIGLIYRWVQSVGGIKIAWLIVVNEILTALDNLKIGFFTALYWILDLLANLHIKFLEFSLNIQNYLGDMKVGVLNTLQDMVNGAIDIINKFIGYINKIPGISIETIEHVTFGTTAEIENEAEKRKREMEFNGKRSSIESEIANREATLGQMKFDAKVAAAKRQLEINTAKIKQADDSNFEPPFREYNVEENLANIADNTSALKDSMEISEEDLTYMRDLAEREVIDRTVLRDVKFEVSNSFGDVRETADVDGIITRIEERLSEAIESEAEGDYNV